MNNNLVRLYFERAKINCETNKLGKIRIDPYLSIFQESSCWINRKLFGKL